MPLDRLYRLLVAKAPIPALLSVCSMHTTPYALVVLNNLIVQRDVQEMLATFGFRAFTVDDGEQALEVLHQHHTAVTLLFTDLYLHGAKDGFVLADTVSKKWPDVAVIVASGQLQIRPDALSSHATFIPKPFTADVIREHLHEILPEGKKPEPLKHGYPDPNC